MATVRMSDGLISEIEYRARRVAEATTPEIDFDSSVWAEKFYVLYMNLPAVARYADCMSKGGHLAATAWEDADTISQVTFSGHRDSRIGQMGAHYMAAKLYQPRKFPAMCVSYSGARICFHDAAELTDEMVAHVKLIDANRDAVQRRNQEVKDFSNGITSACRQFNTLNQALKHVPMLEKLVPVDYMEKVKKKATPRVKKAKPEPELDYDAQAAVSRIATATLLGKL